MICVIIPSAASTKLLVSERVQCIDKCIQLQFKGIMTSYIPCSSKSIIFVRGSIISHRNISPIRCSTCRSSLHIAILLSPLYLSLPVLAIALFRIFLLSRLCSFQAFPQLHATLLTGLPARRWRSAQVRICNIYNRCGC